MKKKIAYLDCFSGISGDMTLGAIIDAGFPVTKLRAELKKLGVPGWTISTRRVKRCSVTATKVDVKLTCEKPVRHRHFPDIVKIIETSLLAPTVKTNAIAIFNTIATAEGQVHATSIEKVHFHEVGAIDSIIDIVGTAIGLAGLGVDRVEASPVNTGSGAVKTEHGTLPVPAPATALILRGIPSCAEGPARELTTPTGAGIVKTMAKQVGLRPMMTVETIGHGAGKHDFKDRPNVLRLFIGQTDRCVKEERLVQLATNIDDMNPEGYPPVIELLQGAGALDVTIIPAQMKKGRPGVILTVLCAPGKTTQLEEIIFKHTTTLGIRRAEVTRANLPRETRKVQTPYGAIQVKFARLPDGGVKAAPEFESVKKSAIKHGEPFELIYRAAMKEAQLLTA